MTAKTKTLCLETPGNREVWEAFSLEAWKCLKAFLFLRGEKVVDSIETLRQIEVVKGLTCNLLDDGNILTWNDFDNPEETRTLFQKQTITRIIEDFTQNGDIAKMGKTLHFG